MNSDIVRHINNLYDHIDRINYQTELINNYTRLNRTRNSNYLYNNPLFNDNISNRRYNQNLNTNYYGRLRNIYRDNLNPNPQPPNTQPPNTQPPNPQPPNPQPPNPQPPNPQPPNPQSNTLRTEFLFNIPIPVSRRSEEFRSSQHILGSNSQISFSERIHNILSNLNIDDEMTDTETQTNVIISHKSISNNTSIEIFNENIDNGSTENIDNGSTENIDNGSTENIDNGSNENIDNGSTENIDNISNEITRCVICLENINNNSIVRRINKCNHLFHINCIDKWFENKITCPTCRQDIR